MQVHPFLSLDVSFSALERCEGMFWEIFSVCISARKIDDVGGNSTLLDTVMDALIHAVRSLSCLLTIALPRHLHL